MRTSDKRPKRCQYSNTKWGQPALRCRQKDVKRWLVERDESEERTMVDRRKLEKLPYFYLLFISKNIYGNDEQWIQD